MKLTGKTKAKVQPRRGHLIPRVKWGWLDLDGFGAIALILIILASIFTRAIIVVSWTLIRLTAKHILLRAASAARHHSTGIYRAMRAYYVP